MGTYTFTIFSSPSPGFTYENFVPEIAVEITLDDPDDSLGIGDASEGNETGVFPTITAVSDPAYNYLIGQEYSHAENSNMDGAGSGAGDEMLWVGINGHGLADANGHIWFASHPDNPDFLKDAHLNGTSVGARVSGENTAEILPADGTVCFTRDTMIDTDAGEIAVQDLIAGMMVRTKDNGFQPIRWIGMSPAKDRAVRIKAGALGNARDLVVSPRHRMMLDGWQLEMLFDHDHALVTALELVNDDTIVRDDMADVEYYHVMFDAHEVIYAEGAATESFHPDQPSMGSMDAAAREEIFALFPELKSGANRPEAAANLSPVQAAYVGKNLDAFVGS